MIFNYVLTTGDGSITGNLLNLFEKNRKSSIVDYYQNGFNEELPYVTNQDGEIRSNASALDFNVVTGDHSSLLSLNSQTLLEGEEEVTEQDGQLFYNLASGGYFVDTISGRDVFHFCPELDVSNEDIVNYDKRDFATGILTYSTSTFDYVAIDALRSKVYSDYSNGPVDFSGIITLFDNHDVFLNGQKLQISGYPDTSVTGRLFAIPKKDRINEVYSDEPDLFGSGFIEGHCDLYLNGMEQITDDILELYTGVHEMIETGIQVFINNRIISEQDTYNL